MNRYIFIPYLQQIPQWKECYYDHKTLKQIQQIIFQCETLQLFIRNQVLHNPHLKQVKERFFNKWNNNNTQSEKNLAQIDHKYSQQLERNSDLNPLNVYLKNIDDIMDKWCEIFVQYSYQSSTIVYMFILMRQYQINSRLDEIRKLLFIVRQQKNKILILLQNLYIEAHYVTQAIQHNLAQQVKTTQIFEQFSERYHGEYLQKFCYNHRLRRTKTNNIKYQQKIQQLYLITSDQREKNAYELLDNLIVKTTDRTYTKIIIVGIIMGIMGFIVGLIILTDIINQYHLQANTNFIQHFPIWRGASYILFYLWMLSLDVLFYEKSQINYKLIFQFKTHNMPQSNYLFTFVSILSILYLVLFYIFILKIGGAINQTFIYEGPIFWLCLFVFIFIISPLNIRREKKARFYFYKMLLRVLGSPCIQINFLLIWITEQISSFNQPFGDLFYTVCFVSTKDSPYCLKNAPYASTAFILFILLYRMIQNLKLWHQNAQIKNDQKISFKDPPFIGFFRGLFSFITTILGVFERQKLFNGTFTIWIIFSAWTTLYSWFIDIRYDWGILNRKSKNLLRKKLLFSNAKGLYYFVAVFNLILRAAWILTISPLSTFLTGFYNMLFIMGISYLQLLRRGIWNILRIQNQHIKNCDEFQATIRDKFILLQVREAAKIKQEQLQKAANEQTKTLGQNHPKAKLKRKQTLSIRQMQVNAQLQKQLGKIRFQNNKILFKQKLQIKNVHVQKILHDLKEDREKLEEIRNQVKGML